MVEPTHAARPYRKPSPKPEVTLSYRVSADLADEVHELCHRHGISRSDLLREILEVGLPALKEKRGWE